MKNQFLIHISKQILLLISIILSAYQFAINFVVEEKLSKKFQKVSFHAMILIKTEHTQLLQQLVFLIYNKINKQIFLNMGKQPKSIKAIRQIRKKQPKLIEGVKKTLIIKGNKTSNSVQLFLKDIRAFRRDRSIFYSRRHQIQPFQDQKQIEKYCEKADSSLFLFGSHSKKRPNNIVFGRTFDNKVLDMVEMGLNNFTSFEELGGDIEIPFQVKPFLIFQGDLWETEQIFQKTRNLLNDFFFENNKIQGIEVDKILKIVISFSVLEDRRIFMKTYEVGVEGSDILEDQGKITLEELGPNAQLVIRRTSFADSEIWKKATMVPKPKKKKENKNIKYDAIGNKKGKLYVDRQNLKKIETRKRKIITKENGRFSKAKTEQLNQRQENEFAAK